MYVSVHTLKARILMYELYKGETLTYSSSKICRKRMKEKEKEEKKLRISLKSLFFGLVHVQNCISVFDMIETITRKIFFGWGESAT